MADEKKATKVPQPKTLVVRPQKVQQPVAVKKNNQKKKPKPDDSYLDIVINDLSLSAKRMFSQFEVVGLYSVAIVFVLMHPNGFASGPMNKWVDPSSESAFVQILIKRFENFCAFILFIPLYFGVPKNYRVFSMILSIAWVLLVDDVTYVENLMASVFVFFIVTVKDYRTRLTLIAGIVLIYLNFYKGVRMPSQPLPSSTTTTIPPPTRAPVRSTT